MGDSISAWSKTLALHGWQNPWGHHYGLGQSGVSVRASQGGQRPAGRWDLKKEAWWGERKNSITLFISLSCSGQTHEAINLGINQTCFSCQNHSVTLQSKFNKAPSSKTSRFPFLCQGWLSGNAADATLCASFWKVWGWGQGLQGDPPLFSHLGKGLPKERSCKSHSQKWAFHSCHSEVTWPTVPYLPAIRAATHRQPHFHLDCVSSTWYTQLHHSWEEGLLSPLPSFTAYLLQHLNWEATVAHRTWTLWYRNSIVSIAIVLFPLISRHSTNIRGVSVAL